VLIMIVAVPNKGRLSQPSLDLLASAGIKPELSDRKLIVTTNNPDISILLARAKDIPEIVALNAAQVGITGLDLVLETKADVEVVMKLGFGKAKLVVAVPNNSNIKTIYDLNHKKVATEFVEITKNFFKDKGINVSIVKLTGACENAPLIGLADAIVDLASTGTTLKMNNLRVVDEILETEAVLIVNKNELNNFKVKALITAIKGVLNAKKMVYIMMNVPEEAFERIKNIVPGLKGPTVMKVEAKEPTLAVHVVVSEDVLFETIEKLKQAGARDILIIPIQRLIF